MFAYKHCNQRSHNCFVFCDGERAKKKHILLPVHRFLYACYLLMFSSTFIQFNAIWIFQVLWFWSFGKCYAFTPIYSFHFEHAKYNIDRNTKEHKSSLFYLPIVLLLVRFWCQWHTKTNSSIHFAIWWACFFSSPMQSKSGKWNKLKQQRMWMFIL